MNSRTLHTRFALFLCAFLFGNIGLSWGQAQIGIYESYVVLDINSSGLSWYDLNATTSNLDFNSLDLGVFEQGIQNLTLKGGQNKTYKCNGGDVSGGNLYYRVYQVSSTPSSFSSISYNWNSNDPGGCGGNQTWQSVSNSIDLLSGLSAGNYYLEVYSNATGTPGTVYANNNGNNYKATFRVLSKTISSGTWSSQAIWADNVVPSNLSYAVINHDVNISSDLSVTSIQIKSGITLTLDSGVELTVTGTLTNNGTMTIENGATFKQGSSVTGSGTYNIKQTLSDNAGSGNTLTGRYWYMGTPVPCARSVGFGNAGDLNKVWSFSNGAYAAVADATNLSPTTGYVHRRSDNGTLTFSGANLYAQDETLSLSNNAGTYAGWHLVANPYTAYLDWAQVHSNSTNISPTYYIRSYNSSGPDLSALIAYNASTGLESNTSSYSLGATGSTTAQYIAPLQAIWVKVNVTNPLSSSAGQLNFQRAFTSHQSGNVGLKNSTYFPILARVNLVDDARFDQALIYMNQDMSNAVDANDSEKMFVSGAPQIYTMAAGKKLVMNGLKNNKKKISVPLYLDVPTSKNYELHLTEYVLDYGKILLEDKQEGILTDFTINDTYAFYASSGLVQGRFVLHFYPSYYGVEAQGPSNEFDPTDNSYAEGGEIVVTTDSKGKIQVILDQPRNTTIEGSVRVSDASGRVVHSDQLQGSITEFELDVPSGIYYLTVQYGNILEKKKVFIQE